MDPDALEFGADSDTYKILVDLGNRWVNGTAEEREEFHKLADDIRQFARDNTPIQYAQNKIMDELHANAEVAIEYQSGRFSVKQEIFIVFR